MAKRVREEEEEEGDLASGVADDDVTTLAVEEEDGHSLSFLLEQDVEVVGLDSDLEEEEDVITNRLIEAEEEGSFAAEFYRCGTDWSSLGLSSSSECNYNDHKNPEKKKQQLQRLKQANLFQMWGLQATNNIKNISNNDRSKIDHKTRNRKMAVHGTGGGGGGGTGTSSDLRVNSYCSNKTNNKQHCPRSACPFYKKIPGTPFTVDAFQYGRVEGCRGYILSHFHADHYRGLTKAWSHGPVYCTTLTATLLKTCLHVSPQFIHPLELDIEYVIEGIKVTMLEANHCPGAALIHLRLPNGQCILHTGDFRASKAMQKYPLLANQRVNVVYLDTTYCNHKYRFPPKEDVLRFVVGLTQDFLRKHPKTLIIVGAYSIGKECVYIEISKALGVKIHADSRRRHILHSFGWFELSANLSSNGKETPLHVLPISSLRFEVLEQYLKIYMNKYTAVLAFRPTGWTYSERIGSHLDLIKPKSRGRVTIYGVPYSEHSSFIELQEFIKFLRPDKIIPTVNVGNAAHRDKMQSYFREWLRV